MQKNSNHSDVLLDAYLADRAHYVQFGKDMAKILIQVSSSEQLGDLKDHLLMLSLAHQSAKTHVVIHKSVTWPNVVNKVVNIQ